MSIHRTIRHHLKNPKMKFKRVPVLSQEEEEENHNWIVGSLKR
jgi:hypothetical protein